MDHTGGATLTVPTHIYRHTQHTAFVTTLKKHRSWHTKCVFYILYKFHALSTICGARGGAVG